MKSSGILNFDKRLIKIIIKILLLIFISYIIISLAITPLICSAIFNNKTEEFVFEDSLISKLGFRKNQINNSLVIYELENEASKNLVVISGGLSSTPDTHYYEAKLFYENGYSIMIVDSMKNELDFDNKGLNDFENDLNIALKTVSFDKNILLYGHSAGGNAVICALNDNPCIKGAISVCAFSSRLEIIMHYAKEKAGFFAQIEYPFLYFYEYCCFGKDINETAVDSLNETTVPVLLIESENDLIIQKEYGIISHKNEIKRDNITYNTVKSDNENSHSDLILNGDSVNKEHSQRILDFFSNCLKNG